MISAFILVDVRHEAQKIDIEFMRWLTINKIAFSIVFTKIDKLKQDGNPNSGIEEKIKNYKSVILENWEYLPEIFLTSSTKHIGKENILYYINKLNSDIKSKIKSKDFPVEFFHFFVPISLKFVGVNIWNFSYPFRFTISDS